MDCIRFEIGNRIKNQRKIKKMSQEKLAELAGLNTSYIGQVERGDKNPSIETVYKIAKSLNVDLSDLFKNLMSADNNSNPYPQEIYSIVLECDKEKCKKIYDIISTIMSL